MVWAGVDCFYRKGQIILLREGSTLAQAYEEDFSLEKGDMSFPEMALEKCLEKARLSCSDIEYWVFPYRPFLEWEETLKSSLSRWPLGAVGLFRFLERAFVPSLFLAQKIRRNYPDSGPLLYVPSPKDGLKPLKNTLQLAWSKK